MYISTTLENILGIAIKTEYRHYLYVKFPVLDIKCTYVLKHIHQKIQDCFNGPKLETSSISGIEWKILYTHTDTFYSAFNS